ncbi:MAG: helix-turn-helix domain-containing protein [Patescibacteria group bacterium]|nr:helix-turn-helix domain-containing protein [Patescibacteria group bacterium]
MPYTTNPHLPRLRMEAAQLVLRQGWSTREVARHTGFDHSTIVRWVNRARNSTRHIIPTASCRPHRHPHALPYDTVRRCARSLRSWRRAIPEYLRYYNTERPHLALAMQTPLKVVQRY